MGPTVLIPLGSKSCYRFLSLSARFEPANIVSNNKRDNHYTTENDEKQYSL
jgi:hypothetical protein